MAHKEKVLIVEDDIEQNTVIKKTLSEQYPTWDIVSVFTYDEAEKEVRNSVKKNHFTLFLLDVQLTDHKADRGGFVLADLIRKNYLYYKTPILFLTAVSDEAVYALNNFHCYNYISKSYTTNDLISQINQMQLTGYLNEYITITDSSRIIHIIRTNDIYFLDTSFHVLNLHTVEGIIHTREYKLDTIMDIIPSYFKRVNSIKSIGCEIFFNYFS